jgi:putative ABC transport system permease protein
MSIQSAIAQGVLWGIMTLGVYITFKLLDYADMTVDGSFALGGAVSAVFIVVGYNPFFSLLIALTTGFLAGAVTGFLNTKLKIPSILSGILSMIALYSINLSIMSGKANIAMLGLDTVFSRAQLLLPDTFNKASVTLVIGTIFTVIIITVLYWFFGTEIGELIRATGSNEYMVRAMGGNTDRMKVLGLLISNGLVALSGGLVAQSQGYADVGMGTGTIVIGLASVIIGEVIFGNRFNFYYKMASVVAGSVVYRVVIAIVLRLGLKSTNLKLFTAIIVAMALAIPTMKKAFIRQKAV